MDNSMLKRLAAAGALVGALLVGGVSLAGAQEADDSTTTVPETDDSTTTVPETDDSTTETPGDREGCDDAEDGTGTGASSEATSST